MNTTASLLRIWLCFLRNPTEERYGLEIGALADVGPGALYPRLKQMVREGYLSERLDKGHARIYYRLTTEGYLAAVSDIAPYQLVSTPAFAAGHIEPVSGSEPDTESTVEPVSATSGTPGSTDVAQADID